MGRGNVWYSIIEYYSRLNWNNSPSSSSHFPFVRAIFLRQIRTAWKLNLFGLIAFSSLNQAFHDRQNEFSYLVTEPAFIEPATSRRATDESPRLDMVASVVYSYFHVLRGDRRSIIISVRNHYGRRGSYRALATNNYKDEIERRWEIMCSSSSSKDPKEQRGYHEIR